MILFISISFLIWLLLLLRTIYLYTLSRKWLNKWYPDDEIYLNSLKSVGFLEAIRFIPLGDDCSPRLKRDLKITRFAIQLAILLMVLDGIIFLIFVYELPKI
jgi:hypothetical protein